MHEDVTLKPHLIVTGNPGEGFRFCGPFENFRAASDYSDECDLGFDWWIAPIVAPEKGQDDAV